MSRKIIWRHNRAVGDCLMFTCGVRDFKLLLPDFEIAVAGKFKELWENNPYINQELLSQHSMKNHGDVEDGIEFYKVGYPIINNANNANTHFTQGFLFDMLANADYHERLPLNLYEVFSAFSNGRMGDPDINAEETKIYGQKKHGGMANMPKHLQDLFENGHSFCRIFARQRPEIFMTEEEKARNIVKKNYGYERYWVVAPGGKRDCTTKIWDWRRFQDVIDYFDGQLKFVVIGRSDHLVEPLNNVVDLTDKFNDNLRGIFSLVYNSEGCVSGVSFLMHLAAAMPAYKGPMGMSLRKPCVSIYGGREPITFTCYNQHQIMHTGGAFRCCEDGGCWQSRTIPLMKDGASKNTRMCHKTVVIEGRTIQACMDTIKSKDVIRGILKYYEGNIYKPLNAKPITAPFKPEVHPEIVIENKSNGKEINILASLQSKGGGEQSALKIADVLRDAGWKVHFWPWGKVHENWKEFDLEKTPTAKDAKKDKVLPAFEKLSNKMKSGIPLLFYANDQIWDFVTFGERLVNISSEVAVAINFANGSLPKSEWLSETGKLKGVLFQNAEKQDEFVRDQIGFDKTQLIIQPGAIDLDAFLEVCPKPREGNGDFVVLKHCTGDWRKYITEESENTGEKIHIWQKHIFKERDTKFYKRLLNDCKFPIRFEFMESHPELQRSFKGDQRMVFHQWNSMPVTEFLGRGHVYLYRTSNKWRDQYPRVVGEALAAGLPVLTEPRDGTRDRVDHGNTGLHCIDYDMFLDALKKLRRKEKMRQAMGEAAKDWARMNLDPRNWVNVLDSLFYGDNDG